MHGDQRRAVAVGVVACEVAAEGLVVGEAEEFDRGDRRLGGLEFGELGALAAQFVGVDANPAVAGVQQGGADLFGAGDLGFGDLLVADHHLPLDECFFAELLLAVVGRRRRGLAVDAHPGADQPFGADQFDAHPLQLDGSDVEEVLGDVEFEFDLGGFVLEGEVGEPGDQLDLFDRGADQLAQSVEVLRALGDLDGGVVGVPHVVGGAPAGAVSVVDQFESHDPRVARIVGDHQPDAGEHHRLAGEAALVSVEFVAELAECVVEFVGAAAHHVVGLGERAECGAQCLYLGLALSAEVGLPAVLEQERAGDPVDELGVDRGGVDAGAGGADRRHRRGERGDRRVDRLGGDRLPSRDGERAFVDDHGGDAPRRHGASGQLGHSGEPGEGVGQELGLGQLGQPDGGAHGVELHRRGVERRSSVDVEAQSADRTVGDRGVVPAGALPVGVEVAEPAVEPGHRRGVDAVPAPHVQRAASPRALRHVWRPVTRHRGHPLDATERLSQRWLGRRVRAAVPPIRKMRTRASPAGQFAHNSDRTIDVFRNVRRSARRRRRGGHFRVTERPRSDG